MGPLSSTQSTSSSLAPVEKPTLQGALKILKSIPSFTNAPIQKEDEDYNFTRRRDLRGNFIPFIAPRESKLTDEELRFFVGLNIRCAFESFSSEDMRSLNDIKISEAALLYLHGAKLTEIQLNDHDDEYFKTKYQYYQQLDIANSARFMSKMVELSDIYNIALMFDVHEWNTCILILNGEKPEKVAANVEAFMEDVIDLKDREFPHFKECIHKLLEMTFKKNLVDCLNYIAQRHA